MPKHSVLSFMLAGLFLPLALSSQAVALSPWEAYKKAGEEALQVNNYGVAERNMLAAVKEAEKFGDNDVRLAASLKDLAGYYRIRGLFAKSEPLLERELRVREKAQGAEHPDVVANVARMVQFYLQQGKVEKGERLTSLLVSFADRKLKEQTVLKDHFQKLSSYFEKHAGYRESGTVLKQLESVTGKTVANQDMEFATSLDAVAALYKTRNKLALAEQLYKRALELRARSLPPGHLALALSYDNLGSLCAALGNNALAEHNFKQALQVTEKTFDPTRPEIFARLDSLAKAHVSMGEIPPAEALYKRALALMQKGPHAKGAIAGECSYQLASLYMKEGRYSEAAPLLKRSLEVAEYINGPQHLQVATRCDAYAAALQNMSRTTDAARMRDRARSIRGFAVVDQLSTKETDI
jgi:tetratricopeptide (TPR) repeat protein